MAENWPDIAEGLYKDAYQVLFTETINGSTIKVKVCSIQEPIENIKISWYVKKMVMKATSYLQKY